MNKANLAELVHAKIGGTKVQSEEVVQSIFDAIINTLKKGDEVSIAGFGIFKTAKRAARAGRNPRTGEALTIKAKISAKFKQSSTLDKFLN